MRYYIMWGNSDVCSVTICMICAIVTVEMCMTSTLPFRMGQDQIQICQSKGHMQLPVLTFAIFVLSFIVCKIFAVKMHLTLTFRMDQGQMSTESLHVTSYVLAIAFFVLSVIVCKIFTVEMRMTLTFRMCQGQM